MSYSGSALHFIYPAMEWYCLQVEYIKGKHHSTIVEQMALMQKDPKLNSEIKKGSDYNK